MDKNTYLWFLTFFKPKKIYFYPLYIVFVMKWSAFKQCLIAIKKEKDHLNNLHMFLIISRMNRLKQMNVLSTQSFLYSILQWWNTCVRTILILHSSVICTSRDPWLHSMVDRPLRHLHDWLAWLFGTVVVTSLEKALWWYQVQVWFTPRTRVKLRALS